MRLPQPREKHIPEERHLKRRLELVLERRLRTGSNVGRALRPEPRAFGSIAPRRERRKIERVGERQLLGDEPVEGAPAEERTMLVADVRGELLVPQERVGNAEREVEPDDARMAIQQLVEQLLRAPARRIVREEPRVHAGHVDAVGAPGGRVRGDGDDLPSLVARPLRRAEIDADDHVGLARTMRRWTCVNMTLRFSPLLASRSRPLRRKQFTAVEQLLETPRRV